MKTGIIILIVCLIPAVALSATIYVPDDYPNIQDAVHAASDHDTIIVRPGTYEEIIVFIGKNIVLRSEGGPGVTVIDGKQAGTVLTWTQGEGPDSVLDGFTVTNGYAEYGGGIFCNGASPTIRNCIITGNQAGSTGAGLYGLYSDMVIESNVFSHNSAHFAGGGIGGRFCNSPVMRNNAIHENTALLGGGVFSCCFTPTVENNTIWGNSAHVGGGFYACIYTSTFNNNTIVNNTALSMGGGIAVVNASSMLIVNTIIWNNDSPKGPAISIGTKLPAILTIQYSDVQGGQGQVYVQSGFTLNWGVGMIDSDPLFVDEANSDFHLTYPSPCMDTGDNSAVTGSQDFEGDPRIANGAVDMGADEFFTHLYWTGDATPGGNVEVKFIGLPGTTPVGLCIGTGVLDPPIPSMWGEWCLQFPIIGPIDLGKIPSPDGVMIVHGIIPASPPPPYSIPMQTLIGNDLTNLLCMQVQ